MNELFFVIDAEDMLKQFQQEKSWLTSKRNIPKMFDVFADHDRQEIIEDYDEEKEKIWRERHKQKVKEYRQNLKKQEQADDDKITDEEYWQKLEELEIQEEFEREIEKSGTTSFMSEISKNINLFGDKNISNNDFSHSIQSKIYDDLNNLDASIEGHVDTFSKSDSTPHDVDEISNVVLLERKSKICENIPLDMKLSYDFIGAFDEDEIKKDSLTIGFANTDTSLQGIKIDDHKSINTETEDECAKPRLLEDPQKISNVILLNRQVNMNNDMNINIQKENKSQGEVLNCDNSKESKNDGCAKIHLKDSANDKHAEKSKYILLQDYKKQLIELRNEIRGAVLKTHDELCQQLDKYDLKEELEHKIMLLQDELNIEDDNIFDSDCSDEQIYKPTSIGSEKSLKKVSFTEKDHTKYLDDHAPDPPLVLHFKHSTYVPQILESKNSDQIDGPHDIYRVYKNCFVQNTKPFKSILKKTTSSILKPVNEVSNTEAPGFGDTAKQQIQKQKKTSCPIVSI